MKSILIERKVMLNILQHVEQLLNEMYYKMCIIVFQSMEWSIMFSIKYLFGDNGFYYLNKI